MASKSSSCTCSVSCGTLLTFVLKHERSSTPCYVVTEWAVLLGDSSCGNNKNMKPVTLIVGTFNPHSQTLVRYHLSICGCIQLPSGLSAGLWVQVLVVAILGNRDLHLALEEGVYLLQLR